MDPVSLASGMAIGFAFLGVAYQRGKEAGRREAREER